jgi:hypothetical protein
MQQMQSDFVVNIDDARQAFRRTVDAANLRARIEILRRAMAVQQSLIASLEDKLEKLEGSA